MGKNFGALIGADMRLTEIEMASVTMRKVFDDYEYTLGLWVHDEQGKEQLAEFSAIQSFLNGIIHDCVTQLQDMYEGEVLAHE